MKDVEVEYSAGAWSIVPAAVRLGRILRDDARTGAVATDKTIAACRAALTDGVPGERGAAEVRKYLDELLEQRKANRES